MCSNDKIDAHNKRTLNSRKKARKIQRGRYLNKLLVEWSISSYRLPNFREIFFVASFNP